MTPAPIFIGGTGRSGTTILSRYLGSHRDIANVPFESRFLIDQHGLINLFDALTRNYSINQGRLAMRSFGLLMKKHLTNPYTTPYLGYNRYGQIPPTLIVEATNRLLTDLSTGNFRGRDLNTIDNKSRLREVGRPLQNAVGKITKPLLGRPLRLINYSYQHIAEPEEMYIPRYFSDSSELGLRLGAYVEELFGSLVFAPARGWCEDTPANVLHLPFLRSLFPRARFINIVRHPVGVAHSMYRMPWAPGSYAGVADYLTNLYGRLIDCHETALRDFPEQYRAVRLEDLVNEEDVRDVLDFIGLENGQFDGSINIEKKKIDHYRSQLEATDLKYLHERLAPFIDYFGYYRDTGRA